MSNNPWPKSGTSNVLFLLDARHSVERSLLVDWLAEYRAQSCFRGTAEQAVISSWSKPEARTVNMLWNGSLLPETLIVPVRVVWQSSIDITAHLPHVRDLWHRPRQPSKWRAKRILKSHPERAVCIAAQGATLGELHGQFRLRFERQAAGGELGEFIIGQAALALDVAERQLAGSRYKVPRDVARHLKAQPEFRSAIAEIADRTGRSAENLTQEADEIMKELVSKPNAFWIDVLGLLSRKIRSLGYDENVVIDKAALEDVRQITREYPTVFLFTHKTHVDGFAHVSVLYDNDFPAPHALGGINMAFAGIGFLFRRAGGIFIRRSFKDDELYKTILRQYIGYLMDKRFPLSWAFEGTRSRVGKLMPPRFGLLKYVIESAYATGAQNLHIIPVAINYDLIGDVSDFATEQAGKKKRPESLGWFLGYLRELHHPMGKIYLDYGEPVVLERAPDPEDTVSLAKIAMRVGVEVNNVTPVTLPSLVSMVLLGFAPGALTAAELRHKVVELIKWAQARGIRLTSHFEPEYVKQMTDLVEVMIDNGLIARFDEGPETLYAIAPGNHSVASYYRNTIVHFFVSKAIAELALLHSASVDRDRGGAFWREAEKLRDLFKFEFFYAPTEEFRDEIRGELRRTDPDWESHLVAEANSEYPLQLLDRIGPLVAHSTLLPYVEAYRIVVNTIDGHNGAEPLSMRDCVSQCLLNGRQAWLQRRISSESSFGKLLFENGYKMVANKSLVDNTDPSTSEQRTMLIQELRDLARRIRALRVRATPGQF